MYGAAQGDEHERHYSPATRRGTRTQRVTGNPDPAHIATSYVERQNLNIRMQNRRFTRLTNAFSKKVANHAYQVALYTVFYNFCRIHKTLKMTPAMAAGITSELRDVDWIAGLVEARDSRPRPRGPYRRGAEEAEGCGAAVDFNFYGPRVGRLGQYLTAKYHGLCGPVSFEPLVRPDVEAALRRLESIRLFHLKRRGRTSGGTTSSSCSTRWTRRRKRPSSSSARAWSSGLCMGLCGPSSPSTRPTSKIRGMSGRCRPARSRRLRTGMTWT